MGGKKRHLGVGGVFRMVFSFEYDKSSDEKGLKKRQKRELLPIK